MYANAIDLLRVAQSRSRYVLFLCCIVLVVGSIVSIEEGGLVLRSGHWEPSVEN